MERGREEGVVPGGIRRQSGWQSVPPGWRPFIHANRENSCTTRPRNNSHQADGMAGEDEKRWGDTPRYGFNRFIKLLLKRGMGGHFAADWTADRCFLPGGFSCRFAGNCRGNSSWNLTLAFPTFVSLFSFFFNEVLQKVLREQLDGLRLEWLFRINVMYYLIWLSGSWTMTS